MFAIPKEQTALLVIDMQRVFFDQTCSLGTLGLDVKPLCAAIPGTLKLVRAARQAGVPVIFTRYVYAAGMADFGRNPGGRTRERLAMRSLDPTNTEIEIIPEIEVEPQDVVIDKSRPSAFYATRLEPVLTSQGIRNLVLCGVTTNICVESTARDAGQRDYGTYVVRDAVAEVTPERNHYSLVSINWMFGDVVSTIDVEASWGGRASLAAVG